MEDFQIPLGLSYERNENFTGREVELEALHKLVEDTRARRSRSSPIVICGTGGMGKTQLVREYVYKHKVDFSSIVWIDAQTVQTTRTGFLNFIQRLIDHYARKSNASPAPYQRIARLLNMGGLVTTDGQVTLTENTILQAVLAVKLWLQQTGNQDWLLVFDNVDDLETFRISDFFPAPKTGITVLTSRRPESARLGVELPLDMMSEEDGIELLRKCCIKSAFSDEGLSLASLAKA